MLTDRAQKSLGPCKLPGGFQSKVVAPRNPKLVKEEKKKDALFSSVDLDQSLFQPFPSEVIFQNYTPCELYEVPLILRNNDKIPRLVKVVLESSPYFRVVSPNDVCNKVAPGMPSTFRILFTPEENKDYFHEVTCITEREKFIVPIRAIGARGILDFPDQLNFSTCPVKPFSVEPSIGTLGVQETEQFTVEFRPEKTGSHSGDFLVHYDTGEDIHVSLYGAATDVNRLVVIHNRSDIIAHFQWKVFATQEEEEQKKHSLCHTLQAEEEGVLDQLLLECPMNPALREHLSIVTRTFQNRLAMEGDVWPNSTTEISVIFRPQEAGVYQRTVYCDISGRETRLPLRIKGEAMAPKLSFNFDQLDVGKIFVGSVHSYEAILSNQGAIDALFDLMWPSTALGSCFNFQPSEGIVEPGSHQAIQITFSSTILGHFLEEFKFSVNGSPQPVTLVIRGCVIGPTFHFNVPSLSFGDVSFGFPRTLSCCLSNTSLVPMTFSLRVPGDGTGEPSVTLCPNTVKTYETALVVDVKGSGEDVLALPIAARCVCPALRVANPVVNFGRCFLKFPYQQMARLVNDSDLPGCYGVLPQERGKLPAVLHSSPAPCGIIEPRSSIEIPLTLEVQERGSQEAVAYIAVFGNQDSPLMIRLVTIGEGPVVYVYPDKLNFGCTEVLKDSSRLLYLSNQSVIPAPFDAQMARPWTVFQAHAQSLWRLVPSKGVVPPEAEISLTLIAHLDDTVLFQDDVILEIENSNSYIIPVQATGTGTTIVTDKPFAPAIDLGPHFSLDPCCYRFRITNCGRRAHQLYWMTEGFPAFRPRNALPATGTSRKRKAETPVPVFQLQPLRMELTPGKSMDMFLEGSSDIPKVVKERLVCHAIIGKQSGKECIMKVDVTCEFIAPVLQISSRKITFCVQKNPSDVLTAQYEPLTLKNVSSLPLNIILTLQEPFALCDTNHEMLPAPSEPLTMDVGEIHHLYIRFDPLYRDDLYSRVAEEVLTIRYLEHPQVDHIHLCGEVHFPNLHFQTMDLNFGCILNDTEIVKDISMTNCSPLLVKYRWSFLTDDHESFIRCSAPASVQPSLKGLDLSCDPSRTGITTIALPYFFGGKGNMKRLIRDSFGLYPYKTTLGFCRVSPREAKHPTELDTAKEQELVQPPQAPTDGRKYSREEELHRHSSAVHRRGRNLYGCPLQQGAFTKPIVPIRKGRVPWLLQPEGVPGLR
ncbi:hypothetical protein EYD10_10907 [Varanus komodoensis]|nr:hypothetical protein EYD10_10907 [Varanus komodoensis]